MPPYDALLSLDLSKESTGWAYWRAGRLLSGVWKAGTETGDPAALFNVYERWIAQKAASLPSRTLFVIEQPHLRGRVSFAMVGLFAMTVMVARRFGHGSMDCHSKSVKKHATGSGNADKADMIAAAMDRGWEVRNDDEADALWILDFAKLKIREGGQWPAVIGIRSP